MLFFKFFPILLNILCWIDHLDIFFRTLSFYLKYLLIISTLISNIKLIFQALPQDLIYMNIIVQKVTFKFLDLLHLLLLIEFKSLYLCIYFTIIHLLDLLIRFLLFFIHLFDINFKVILLPFFYRIILSLLSFFTNSN